MSVRPVALRWAFLVALALGIVGMHHLAMPGGEPQHAGHATAVAVASVAADPACCDNMAGHGMHDLLHLCLAVLGAAVGLLLSWLLLRRGTTTASSRSRTALAALAGRDPPSPPTVDFAVLSASCGCDRAGAPRLRTWARTARFAQPWNTASRGRP